MKTVKGLFDNVISYFRIERLIFLVPICGFALYDSVFQAFSSILGVLREAYPDVSVTTIQMIIAIPPMASIPGTLLSGVLSSYVRKKRIVEFALAVIFVGGMIPVVFRDPTLEAMFACSACVGVGQGLLHPMANAFICQTWEDDQRSRALGFKQSFNFIGDALVALCVGYLSLSHWGNAFLVYLGVIPIFILAHVLFPEGELEQKLVTVRPHARRRTTVANGNSHCDEMLSDGDSSSSQSRGVAVPHPTLSVATTRTAGLRELFKPRMVYLFVLFAFAMMFLYGFNTNIAMLVQERGLGNAADVSKIASVVSITSFLLGIIYGKVTEVCGRYTLVAGYVLLACGMLVASFGASLPAIAFGGILFGLGSGIQQISTIYYVSKTADKTVVTMGISVAVSFVSLGATLSPVVINGLQGVIFGSTSPAQALLLAGCGYVVLAFVEGLASKFRRDGKNVAPMGKDELEID